MKTIDNPHLLVMNPYHLSAAKARSTLISTLENCNISCPKLGWKSINYNWGTGDQANGSFTFDQLLKEVRENGILKLFQDKLDNKDSIFGGTIGEMSSANFQMKNEIHYLGWTKSVSGPFRSSCVELELSEDLLDHRRLACHHSNEYDFKKTARHFRAFLTTCISLVDAYINRHIVAAKHDGFTSSDFDKLQNEFNLEEKIRLLWKVCSTDDPQTLLQSKAWCHFQEIRKKRNELIHIGDPIFVYSINEMQSYFNKVRTGIGELLLLHREAHSKPTLGFIERLRTAPLIDYIQ